MSSSGCGGQRRSSARDQKVHLQISPPPKDYNSLTPSQDASQAQKAPERLQVSSPAKSHSNSTNKPSTFDLPPTVFAKALPTYDPHKKKTNNKKNQNKKVEPKKKPSAFETKLENGDDAPKAFRRLMQFQQDKAKPSSSGLDTGESRKRKRDAGDDKQRKKKNEPAATSVKESAAGSDIPKILPGEKMADFAARVDRELPLSAMKKSNKPASSDMPKIREERVTKHEKRLLKLQRQWREEEAQIRDKENAEKEDREADMEDQLHLWKEWAAEAGTGKGKKNPTTTKKKNRGKGRDHQAGDSDIDDDPDPWAKLKNPERMNKPANPLDVAQAPPQLTKPKEKFKVRGGARVDVANVPAAVGSLRRREELAGERRNIVDEYRRKMAEKRQ